MSKEITIFANKSYNWISFMAKTSTPLEDITLNNINSWLNSENSQQMLVNEHFAMGLHNGKTQAVMMRDNQIYRMAEGRVAMVTRGNIDLTLDLEEQTWQQGDIVLMTPDSIQEIKHRSDDFDVIAFAFKSDIYVGESLLLHTNASEWREMLQLMYMLWSLASHKPFRQKTVFRHIETIVSNIQDIAQAEQQRHPLTKPTSGELLFWRFKKLVSENCERERNVPFYAEKLFISPHHLSAVISRQSGKSVMYWINRATVLKAKVLIKTSGMRTSEIADKLNFPYHSTFTKFFKRETGMSPQEYRDK